MVNTKMTFEYAWLKILQVLAKEKRQLSVDQLREALASRGFAFDGKDLEKGLDRLRDQGLVETLVFAGGGLESLASVAITAKGERKVRGIVHL